MTKQTRKKSNVIFDRSNTNVVVINDNDFIDIMKYDDDNRSSNETIKLLKLLLKGTSLLEQQKDILNKKSLIRSFMLKNDNDNNDDKLIQITLESLIYLYISPDYSVLRKSLDWIVDIVVKCVSISLKDKRQCIRNVFYRLQSNINFEDSAIDIDKVMSFTLSLNCLVTLDKETLWLDEETNTDDTTKHITLCDDSLMFQYVNTSAKIFQYCAKYIIDSGVDIDSLSYDKEVQQNTSIGAEIIRYAECTGECLRGIMTALKSRLNTYTMNTFSDSLCTKWSLLIRSMMASSCRILSSVYLHKDIITQTAMFAIYLQWLCRFSYGNTVLTDKMRPGIQLIALLNILDNDNYTLNEGQIATTINLGIHQDILHYCGDFPAVSRFALIRGILSVFDDESLLFCANDFDLCKIAPEINDIVHLMNEKYKVHVNDSHPSNFSLYCYEIIKVTCSHATSDRQIYGLQLLEAWLTRLYNIKLPNESLQDKFQLLSSLIIKAWSHPYKQLNHLAPNIYQKLIDTIYLYEQKLNIIDNGIWKYLVNEALSRSSEHRSRYQALTILLPKIGAKSFMETRPSLLDELVGSITFRDVCVSVSSFIGVLLRSYVEQLSSMGLNGIEEGRLLWIKPIIEAICSYDVRIRINAVDYLVPDILKIDPHCGYILMKTIRTLTADKNLVLWGLINICNYCRLYGLPGQEICHEEESHLTSNLKSEELIWSCISDDDELRLRSLNLISTSQKTAAPLVMHELSILRKVFKYNLKSAVPDHRHRICRTLKAIVFRVSEAHRVAVRDLKKVQIKLTTLEEDRKVVVGNEALGDLDSKFGDLNKLKLQLVKNISDSQEVFDWLRDTVLENLYPGTTYDRELMALDIIDSIIEVVGTQSPLLDGLFTEIMTNTFLNLLISSWDRTRYLAAELLTKFPYPLPNYTNRSDVSKLLSWATTLAGSVRQRESDAGALMIKVIFTIYCSNLGWDNIMQNKVDDLVISTVDPREADVLILLQEHLKFCQSNTPIENVYALDIEELVSPDITVFCGRINGTVVAVGALRKIDELHAELKSMHTYTRDRCKGLGTSLVQFILDFAKCQGYSRVSIETGTSEDYAPARALYKKFHFRDCPPFGYYEPSEVSVCMTLDFKGSIEITCTNFLNVLSNTLELRLASLDKLLRHVNDINDIKSLDVCDEEQESTPLCHGLLMAIRYCLEVAADKKILISSVWPPLIRRLLNLATESLRVAMTVVAEAPSDAPFAPVIGSYNTAASSSTMSASYINTNSVMGAGTENDIIDEKGSEIQRAVVGAWLLVKEASAMLATLVKISPPTKDSEISPKITQNVELLTFQEIKFVGATILEALGRLKHMGAIAEAHSALQTISECLLRHGERSPQLCRLPSVWLNEILERLKSERQVFILRRSAGFAYSFLSILRSEPPNALPLLLQTAMSNLLRYIESNLDDIAENASSRLVLPTADGLKGSWRGCVHALNVIRLILIDGSLGKELDSYISRATQLAVIGFSSSKWAVRNSSMMVFSAVIQRAVNHDKNGSGGSNAITVSDFFHRYPTLFPFLLSELAAITCYKVVLENGWPSCVEFNPLFKEKAHDNVNRGAQEGGLHPSLYPILLLLAKLRSPLYREDMRITSLADDNSELKRINVDLFIPLIMSCRSQKFQKVREMAAKAFIPLVSIEDIPKTVEEILSNLNRMSIANDLHGSLLLIDGILQNLSEQIDDSKSRVSIRDKLATEIENNVFPYLVQSAKFILSKDCPAISIVFLRILKTMVCLIGLKARGLLYSFCHQLLIKVINIDESNRTLWKPYEPLLLRDALHSITIMTIETQLGLQKNEFENEVNSTFLLPALSHNMSEVREGILTAFLHCITIDDDIQITDEKRQYLSLTNTFFSKYEVMSVILNAACTEKEPDIMQLFFDFLCRFVRSNTLLSLDNEIKQLFLNNWDNLNSFLFTATGALSPTNAASSATEILGWIIALLGSSIKDSEVSLEQIITWQDLVEKACTEENPSTLRESVARSIEASNILTNLSIHATSFQQNINQHSISAYDQKLSNLACRLWLVALTLMQDDDDDIRNIMNKAVAPALEICNINQHPNFLTIGTYSIDMMINNLSSCIVYSTLTHRDNDISMGVQVIINELFSKTGEIKKLKNAENELDKIFQAEQWNVFIEVNVCTDVLSAAIGKSLDFLALHDKHIYMKGIIQQILTRSSNALDSFYDLNQNDQWIGGILLQKDIFSVIYSTLFTIQEIITSLNNDEKMIIKKLLEKMELLFSSNKIHPKLDKVIKNISLNM